MLFETQAQWGESQDSKADVFFGYAEELGLDMAEFKAVYNDPATKKKIERDQADGKALGVEGTPSFFINGEKVDEPSPEALIAAIDAELGT